MNIPDLTVFLTPLILTAFMNVLLYFSKVSGEHQVQVEAREVKVVMEEMEDSLEASKSTMKHFKKVPDKPQTVPKVKTAVEVFEAQMAIVQVTLQCKVQSFVRTNLALALIMTNTCQFNTVYHLPLVSTFAANMALRSAGMPPSKMKASKMQLKLCKQSKL